MSLIRYAFSSKLWKFDGKGGWYFVSLPQDLAQEIRSHSKSLEEGWGRMKVTAEIGSSTWKTSIWFDTKLQTYLLPVNAQIRKHESLIENQLVQTVILV